MVCFICFSLIPWERAYFIAQIKFSICPSQIIFVSYFWLLKINFVQFSLIFVILKFSGYFITWLFSKSLANVFGVFPLKFITQILSFTLKFSLSKSKFEVFI